MLIVPDKEKRWMLLNIIWETNKVLHDDRKPQAFYTGAELRSQCNIKKKIKEITQKRFNAYSYKYPVDAYLDTFNGET